VTQNALTRDDWAAFLASLEPSPLSRMRVLAPGEKVPRGSVLLGVTMRDDALGEGFRDVLKRLKLLQNESEPDRQGVGIPQVNYEVGNPSGTGIQPEPFVDLPE